MFLALRTRYYIILFFLIVFCNYKVVANDVELELYYNTLLPENVEAYNRALEAHLATPPVEVRYSKNDKINNQFIQALHLPENNVQQLAEKMKSLMEFAKKGKKRNEVMLELSAFYNAFLISFEVPFVNYSESFQIALKLEKKLHEVSEQEYPDKREVYFKLGEAYYLFKEYEKSISLLKHAITDNPPRSFTDCANLDARKIIGICYANLNQMDTSDYYFQSTLKSPDIVINRPVYNATAVAHLSCNCMMKGEYEKALRLDKVVLPYLKDKGEDYGHLAGMYACQCFSYFNLNELENVIEIADSVLLYANKDNYNKNKRLKQAYYILAKYNIISGNADKALEYGDSLISIYKQEEKVFTSQHILQAINNEINDKETEVKEQQEFIIIVLIIFTITVILLSIIFILYRRQRTAYKSLIEKSEQWAASSDMTLKSEERNGKKSNTPDEEDIQIARKLHEFMLKHKPYKDQDLTIDSLSDMLNVNRNKLSRAINRTLGKNFNLYVNEFRVKEVIKLMSEKKSYLLTIDELMEQAGFNGRTSFFHHFKKITGLSPAEYRRNREKYISF